MMVLPALGSSAGRNREVAWATSRHTPRDLMRQRIDHRSMDGGVTDRVSGLGGARWIRCASDTNRNSLCLLVVCLERQVGRTGLMGNRRVPVPAGVRRDRA